MTCFSEFTYLLYADRELPLDETEQVEAHLFVCPRCRALVEALSAENRVLAEALEATPALPTSRLGISLFWMAASALLVAFGLDRALTWLKELIPGSTEWLNPFSASGAQMVLFYASAYLTSEGPVLLKAISTVVGILALGGLVLVVVRFVIRRGPSAVALLPLGILLVSLPHPASAIETRHGVRVTVPTSQTVDASLFASGQSVEIDGTVNGNLFVSAQRVVIRGTVKGDVFSPSQSVDVEGTVGGSVYTFAHTVTVSGEVKGSIMTWAEDVEVLTAGRVQNDVMAGADTVRVNGAVGRDVTCLAGTVQAAGSIGRNLHAHANQILLASTARVGGDLKAYINNRTDLTVEPGATIRGKTAILQPVHRPSRYTQPRFYFWQAVRLGAAFLIGLLLNWLFPSMFTLRLETPGSVLRAGGTGFLVLVVTPIAAIVVCVTLIGLPIGLIGLAFWGMGLYLAKVFVASYVGDGLLRPKIGPPRPFALSLLLGLFLLFIAFNLPHIGGWISLLTILLGLGIAFRQWQSRRRESHAVVT